jgi:hypothetical protein
MFSCSKLGGMSIYIYKVLAATASSNLTCTTGVCCPKGRVTDNNVYHCKKKDFMLMAWIYGWAQ